jgi:hypothetical protein
MWVCGCGLVADVKLRAGRRLKTCEENSRRVQGGATEDVQEMRCMAAALYAAATCAGKEEEGEVHVSGGKSCTSWPPSRTGVEL